jgi:hypothetical protein
LLKLKAKLKGRSLEQELRAILRRAAELNKEEKLALVDSIRSMTPRRLLRHPAYDCFYLALAEERLSCARGGAACQAGKRRPAPDQPLGGHAVAGGRYQLVGTE